MKKITALALCFFSCSVSAASLDYLDDLSFQPHDNQPAIFEPILESIQPSGGKKRYIVPKYDPKRFAELRTYFASDKGQMIGSRRFKDVMIDLIETDPATPEELAFYRSLSIYQMDLANAAAPQNPGLRYIPITEDDRRALWWYSDLPHDYKSFIQDLYKAKKDILWNKGAATTGLLASSVLAVAGVISGTRALQLLGVIGLTGSASGFLYSMMQDPYEIVRTLYTEIETN